MVGGPIGSGCAMFVDLGVLLGVSLRGGLVFLGVTEGVLLGFVMVCGFDGVGFFVGLGSLVVQKAM